MKWAFEVLSWLTGRNVWLEAAARMADREGNVREAIEFRNAVDWRRQRGLR